MSTWIGVHNAKKFSSYSRMIFHTYSDMKKLLILRNKCVEFCAGYSGQSKYRVANVPLLHLQRRIGKWKWIGHALRKSPSSIVKMALEWKPQGSRPVGRPKATWRRSILILKKRIQRGTQLNRWHKTGCDRKALVKGSSRSSAMSLGIHLSTFQ